MKLALDSRNRRRGRYAATSPRDRCSARRDSRAGACFAFRPFYSSRRPRAVAMRIGGASPRNEGPLLPALSPKPMHVTGAGVLTRPSPVVEGRRVASEMQQAKRQQQRLQRENEGLVDRNRKLSTSLSEANRRVASLTHDAKEAKRAATAERLEGFKRLLDSERETDAAREREARAVAEVASLRDELQRNASAAETVQEDLQRQVDVAEAEVTELRRQLDSGRSTLRRVCAERTQTFESALSDVSRLSRAAASATAEDSPSSPPSPQPRQPAEEVPAASLEAIPPRNVRGLPQSESSVELAAVAGIVAAAVRQTLPLPVMMPTPPQERPSSRFVPRRYVPRPPSGPYLGRARQSSRELRPYPQPSQQVVEPPASRPASQPLAHSETSSADSSQLESHPRSRNRPDEDTPCGPVRRAMSRASVGGSAAAGGASGKAEGEADVEAAGSEAGGNAWPGGAPWAPWPAARPIGTPTTPSYGRRAPKASYP